MKNIDITSITGLHTGQAFQEFVNITMLTLSDRGWKAKFKKWTPYDQNYLDNVKYNVEFIFWQHFHSEEMMPDEHRIKLCQDMFEEYYGLNIYKEWGAWAEGYFDNFGRRVREYNIELDRIRHEFGTVDDSLNVNNELPF